MESKRCGIFMKILENYQNNLLSLFTFFTIFKPKYKQENKRKQEYNDHLISCLVLYLKESICVLKVYREKRELGGAKAYFARCQKSMVRFFVKLIKSCSIFLQQTCFIGFSEGLK